MLVTSYEKVPMVVVYGFGLITVVTIDEPICRVLSSRRHHLVVANLLVSDLLDLNVKDVVNIIVNVDLDLNVSFEDMVDKDSDPGHSVGQHLQERVDGVSYSID